MRLNHSNLWTAIDNLAMDKRISCSRMAVLSRLDATSFNKSKRFDTYGRPHWPSVETLAKLFDAMNVSWTDFAKYFPSDESASERKDGGEG